MGCEALASEEGEEREWRCRSWGCDDVLAGMQVLLFGAVLALDCHREYCNVRSAPRSPPERAPPFANGRTPAANQTASSSRQLKALTLGADRSEWRAFLGNGWLRLDKYSPQRSLVVNGVGPGDLARQVTCVSGRCLAL